MAEIIEKMELVYDPEDEYIPAPEPEPEPAKWLDGSYRIGIHTTIAGDIARSLDIAHKLGCNALQIFTSSPRMWPRPGRTRIADADAARFVSRRAELGLGPVAVHANYLINLAATEPVARVRTIQVFRDEIVRAMSIGADFLIVHPGSARDGNMVRGAELVSDALRQAGRGLKLGGLRILIENTAGMGNCIGSRFEELAAIIAGVPEVEVGVCLDTAHLFAAGFPIHTPEGLEQTLTHVDRSIGLDRVMVLHVNDSKTAHGSRVDRHEHVGHGKIGSEALARVLKHPLLSPQRVAGRAFLLETPIDAPGDDRRNVAAVWKLVGVAVEQVPDAEDGFSMLAKHGARKKTSPQRKAAKTERKAGAMRAQSGAKSHTSARAPRKSTAQRRKARRGKA
ncbi:MAG TPA: deoxyribonuclease IV [Candidatus Acidoferrales bacterium]|nr:deoxyribonuclease IV [Candidatus Acidoferrales bacterium]